MSISSCSDWLKFVHEESRYCDGLSGINRPLLLVHHVPVGGDTGRIILFWRAHKHDISYRDRLINMAVARGGGGGGWGLEPPPPFGLGGPPWETNFYA